MLLIMGRVYQDESPVVPHLVVLRGTGRGGRSFGWGGRWDVCVCVCVGGGGGDALTP